MEYYTRYQCQGLSSTQSASTEKKSVVMLEMNVVIMQRKPRVAPEARLILKRPQCPLPCHHRLAVAFPRALDPHQYSLRLGMLHRVFVRPFWNIGTVTAFLFVEY